MKTPKWIATALALSMTVGNVAFAQGHGHGRGDDSRRMEQRDERRMERRHDRRMERRMDDRVPVGVVRGDDRWDRRDPRWNGSWHRGAGPRHDLYQGGRLPHAYRTPAYVVRDWQGHRLHRPPVGYHWVQAGGDYVLAAITTGVILSILLNN